MKIVRKSKDIIFNDQKTAVALGTFDGLHIGHQKVINSMLEQSRKYNLRSVVYTFANHPKEFTNKNNHPTPIFTINKKIELIEKMGVDELVIIEFDSDQMNMSAHSFIEDLLLKRLNMAHVVVGFNFCFGKGAEGNTVLLQRYADEYAFGLSVIDSVRIDDEVVSSTRIRQMLKDDNIQRADNFLGRGHILSHQVVEEKFERF